MQKFDIDTLMMAICLIIILAFVYGLVDESAGEHILIVEKNYVRK